MIKIEHGSFTPVILSAFGGTSLETGKFLGRLIQKVAEKKSMEKSVVANYIRTKISFELIRSQVAMIRGSRSLKTMHMDTNDAELVNQAAGIREHWRQINLENNPDELDFHR